MSTVATVEEKIQEVELLEEYHSIQQHKYTKARFIHREVFLTVVHTEDLELFTFEIYVQSFPIHCL